MFCSSLLSGVQVKEELRKEYIDQLQVREVQAQEQMLQLLGKVICEAEKVTAPWMPPMSLSAFVSAQRLESFQAVQRALATKVPPTFNDMHRLLVASSATTPSQSSPSSPPESYFPGHDASMGASVDGQSEQSTPALPSSSHSTQAMEYASRWPKAMSALELTDAFVEKVEQLPKQQLRLYFHQALEAYNVFLISQQKAKEIGVGKLGDHIWAVPRLGCATGQHHPGSGRVRPIRVPSCGGCSLSSGSYIAVAPQHLAAPRQRWVVPSSHKKSQATAACGRLGQCSSGLARAVPR